MIFARKMPKFYIIIVPKNIFSRILGGHAPIFCLLRLCCFGKSPTQVELYPIFC